MKRLKKTRWVLSFGVLCRVIFVCRIRPVARDKSYRVNPLQFLSKAYMAWEGKIFHLLIIILQVGNTLALEGQLHVREPKRKDWKLSTVVLKNGKMVMDKSKVRSLVIREL